MTRQKLKLTFIENETTRKSTFKKRKGGLLKKAHELATLCGVPICVLINSSYQLHPEMWPSRAVVDKIVSDWKMLPVVDQTKKMVNQEIFLQQRILKINESLNKLKKENKDLEMKNGMFDCINGRVSVSRIEKTDLLDLGGVVDQYLKDVNRRVEILKKNDESSSSSIVVAPTTTSNLMQMVEMSSSVGVENMIHDQIETNLNMKQNIKDLDLNKNSGDQTDLCV